ncbi:MAG: protein kinase [Chloroflexi bacterium]|nr:protein kinase [Chloroflexota bacterium]
MPFIVGETIGPYRILEQLGRGGMATVFKVYHAALDRYVAIKALHPAFMSDPNFLARFQREARVVAKLEHTNIVPIYDFSEYEGRPYLVMKYIEGETLKARLNRGPIDRDELVHVAEAVGSGLAYAHEQGILHRDVKPSNVLLAQDGRVYLADFGLARIAEAGESTLSSDMMLGTPQYISPEQAMGVRELDAGTDIYSFGVMLYELVVGQVPFSADTPFSIIHDHIYSPLPLPHKVNPNVSDAMERVLLKALAKDRADRYADAVLLVEAFKKAFLEEPSPALVEVDIASAENIATPTTPVAPAVEEIHTVLTPEEEKAESSIAEPDDVEPDDDIPAAAEQKPRRRWRWWQIALVVIIVFLCCIVSAQILSRIQEGNIGRPSSIIDESGDDGLPEGFLEDAKQEATDHPDDPYALLNLAAVYWDGGQKAEAEAALEKALELADGDVDIFLQVADMMSEREMWLPAAKTYLELAHTVPNELPEDFTDRFYQAVFMAAEDPEAEKGIPIPAIAEVDEIIEKVVKARFQLYRGNSDEAQATINDVLAEIKPGMPEALLVQAEIFFWRDDIQKARRTLSELEGRTEIPDWMREYIIFLIDEINAGDGRNLDIVALPPDGIRTRLDALDALLAAGKVEEAEAEVNRILELGGDDPGLYSESAEILVGYGDWLHAVPLYVRSASLYRGGPPEELIERIQMAVYFGAGEPNAMEVLSDPAFELPPERIDLAQARHLLYHGDMGSAKSMIGQLLDKPPDLPEERLLEAEMYIQLEDFDAAEGILMDLQADENIPLWIQNEAGNTLAEIRQ